MNSFRGFGVLRTYQWQEHENKAKTFWAVKESITVFDSVHSSRIQLLFGQVILSTWIK